MTSTNLPSPDEMTSPERVAAIMNVRRRIAAGEEVSDEEVRHAIELIAAERKLSTARRTARAPRPAEALSLDDF